MRAAIQKAGEIRNPREIRKVPKIDRPLRRMRAC